MTHKHTLGPWAIAAGKTFCAIRTDDRVIADMRHVGQHYNGADALLIAAAPEMLQALQIALLSMERATMQMGLDPAMDTECNIIRAAINKALKG